MVFMAQAVSDKTAWRKHIKRKSKKKQVKKKCEDLLRVYKWSRGAKKYIINFCVSLVGIWLKLLSY